jgi:hypothetical protein
MGFEALIFQNLQRNGLIARSLKHFLVSKPATNQAFAGNNAPFRRTSCGE